MRSVRFITSLFLVFIATAAMAVKPTLNAGLWEITIKNESPSTASPMTTTICISDDDVAKIVVPRGKQKDDCRVLDGSVITGGLLSFVTKCSKKNVTSSSRFTFNGNAYEGTVEITVDDTVLRQVITGKRLDPKCEDETDEEQPQ